MNFSYGIATAAFAAFAFTGAAQANLLTNGDFEGTTTLIGGLLEPAGWTFTPAASGSYAGIQVGSSFAHTGSQSYFFGAIGGSDDELSQNIATVVGARYQISFWFQGDPFSDPTTSTWDFSAFFGTTPLVSLSDPTEVTDPLNNDYSIYTFTETATAPTTTLAFYGQDIGFYVALDDVAVTPAPEPASLAVFGTALAGLGLVRRRKRKTA
jgi:hypothetical protein